MSRSDRSRDDVLQRLGLEPEEERLWELYHESSKIGLFDLPPSDEQVLAAIADLWESLPYDTRPAIELPDPLPLPAPLDGVLERRASARRLEAEPQSLAALSTLLHYAYGVTHDRRSEGFPRPFRAAPSAGALYPLELYLFCPAVTELEPALYHYDAVGHRLHTLRPVARDEVASAVVQPELVNGSALVVFLTAVFERTTFKYRERGYRFALLEAGHVAQNLDLVATALGLGAVNLGGFFDRRVDALLGIDGVDHSTLYLTAIGASGDEG
jgi:SagB-type dehydrogenase family enzyme